MVYCKVRGRNVPERRCKHTGCITRVGYCQYSERYAACGHPYCREKQGQNLMKLISGLYHIDSEGRLHKLGRNPKVPNLKPRTADRTRKALRVNRITQAGHVNKRRNWREYKSAAEYMRVGRGE